MLTYESQLEQIMTTAISGSVVRTQGTTVAAAGFPSPVGALAEIVRPSGPPLPAEVIGFNNDLTLLYPLDNVAGVRRGDRVRLRRTRDWIRVGPQLLGRVVDARGFCVDDRPQPVLDHRAEVHRDPPNAIHRPRIDAPLSTGIRAIDALLTCGTGQRMGIFAGSGVGKSVLLGMMARYTEADVNVVALIGERGREVNEFIDRDLGPAGREKSVVVVATSDTPAVTRVRAAWTATAIAEYFRDQGKNVLLMMDSLTRFAQAQREIGLAAGEPPTTRGYPPSVFGLLPKLVERAGRAATGSITGFYSVLVEADDPNEPIADAVRGLIDGHTWLSRKLAGRGHYPAIDVLESVSRLYTEITDRPQQDAALVLRELLSALRDNEDLISIGAYRAGSNPTVDVALASAEHLNDFLTQSIDQGSSVAQARADLTELIKTIAALRQNLQRSQAAAAAAARAPTA